MGRRFVFRMLDGSEWTSEIGGSRPLADEIAFERQFKCSVAKVAAVGAKATAYMAEVETAVKAGQAPPEPPDDVLPRTEWLAFFAWRDLRRRHPEVIAATFDGFVDSVDEMGYQEDEEEEDTPDNVVRLEGSGLDPTVPAPPRTPPPSSSSPASATGTSS
jgi:hypothetical protein